MLEWAARLRRREVAEVAGPYPAVAEAYRANLEPIYRFIYRKVGNREAAEDLTGEVFAKAVRGLRAERSPQATQSWLYATARTTIVDYWRRHASEAADLDIADLEDILGAPGEGSGPRSSATVETVAEGRVERLLAALPERDRAVLALRFLRGYTLVEVARELGTSEGNVKVLQHRALKRAAALGRDDHGHG